MKLFLKIVIAVGVIALALVIAPTALAQGGDEYPEGVDPTDVYRIARNLYCDVCAGVPLSDCPSSQCIAWREEIAFLLAEGESDDQIRQHFADRYGDKVSGVPLDDTNRLVSYGVPILLSVLIIGGMGLQISRWNNQNSRPLQAARSAGTLTENNRPVPDNVDSTVLATVLADVEALKQ